MLTAAALKTYTQKDLAQIAKKRGIPGWYSMRKDDLVREIVRVERKRSTSKSNGTKTSRVANGKASNGSAGHVVAKSGAPASANGQGSNTKSNGVSYGGKAGKNGTSPSARRSSHRSARRVQELQTRRETFKDLASIKSETCVHETNGRGKPNGQPHKNGKSETKYLLNGRPPKLEKDRILLMVRDSYWLHAFWELSRQAVQRVRAAMAEHWHAARPVLRLFEITSDGTTNSSEAVVRDIEIHGGVKNWYIDVHEAPKTFRVAIGYKAMDGKFYPLLRSNKVTTPQPDSHDALDGNWTDVAENYEKIFALSGGFTQDGLREELKELFEERLKRPVGAPMLTRYGVGAERLLYRQSDFVFEIDAEMIVYGTTKPDAYVTLAGEPIKIRPDGSFTVRVAMPNRRQVLPIVAGSSNGLEQRTIILAVERNTKEMEPVTRDTNQNE